MVNNDLEKIKGDDIKVKWARSDMLPTTPNRSCV